MSTQTIQLLIAGALLLHGLGHIGAIGALLYIESGRRSALPWLPARSWLFPTLAPSTAKMLASAIWIICTIGFVAASMSFWGVLVPGDAWRPLAVASAVVSFIGITLFIGTWPPFNTIAALGMNVAVLVALLWLGWPPQAMFGK